MHKDPDPLAGLPALKGAPAYARPPKVIPDAERPFDPDELPIMANLSDEERALLTGRGSAAPTAGDGDAGSPDGAPGAVPGDGTAARSDHRGPARFNLRAVVTRRQPPGR